MKKIIIAVFALIIFPFYAYSQSGDDFDIRQNRQGTITITGYSGTVRDVIIPETIEDIRVTDIDERAFSNRQLSSVTIPDSVTVIGNEAFTSNPLTSITLGSNVQFDNSAFPNNFNDFYISQGRRAGIYTWSGRIWSVERGSSFSTEMVFIPAGSFTIGSNDIQDFNASPLHHVTLTNGFWMGKYPVTVGEFRRFVNATGYRTDAETGVGGGHGTLVYTGNNWQNRTDANWRNTYLNQNDRHPVVLVSWYDAIAYCNWLSEEEGLSPAYRISGTGNNRTVSLNQNANGYRLPTEAQWEYAARSGNGSPGNYIYSGSNNPDEVGWYDENSNDSTHEVGLKQPNGLGLYDMSGNIWEWCWDWYDDYTSTAKTDPLGASSGTLRVMRGGSWTNDAQSLRSANRFDGNPWRRTSAFGFRLLRP